MQNLNQSLNLPEGSSPGSSATAAGVQTVAQQIPTQSIPAQPVSSQPNVNQPPFAQQSAIGQPAVTQEEKIYAFMAYLPLVAFLSLILKPESAYVRLHARQGLLLFFIFFFAGIFAALFSSFGLLGSVLAFFIAFIPLATVILGAYSMYLAIMGVWWKIPVIGSISELIPLELFAKVAKESLIDPVNQAKDDYMNRKDVEGSENQNSANNSSTSS